MKRPSPLYVSPLAEKYGVVLADLSVLEIGVSLNAIQLLRELGAPLLASTRP